jgi:hypothetical protein
MCIPRTSSSAILVAEMFLSSRIGYLRLVILDDQEPLVGEETRYQLPLRGRDSEAVDYTKTEIFALGCGIYEIMAWKAPFPGMKEEQISEKYAREEFPGTDGLLVGDIIRACWNEEFEAAADVEIALREKLVGEACSSQGTIC